jgi:hypothetical protein
MPIYVISHLRLKRPHDSGHQVMYVGGISGHISPDEFAITDASTAPNISHKNKTYCELTALHQMAQLHAYPLNDIVGLVHYRRRFVNGSKFIRKLIRITQKAAWCRGFSNALLAQFELTQSEAEKLLEQHDIIVPNVAWLKNSIRESYMQSHIPEDWDKLKHIIQIDFPEYAEAFELLENRKSIHLYNMFIAKASFLQSYASWLFAVMDQLEKVIEIKGRDGFQMRVFGFLSERLLNVYLIKHAHLNVLHMPVVQIYTESVIQGA